MNRRWRLPLWKLMLGVALLAVLMSICLVPLRRQQEHTRLFWQMQETINTLRPSGPRSVNPVVWDCAHDWTITAYGNVCSSPEFTSTREMYRLREDMDRKLRDDVDLDTLVWIWDRLGETGPTGKYYAARYKPAFLECFAPRGSKRLRTALPNP